MFKAVQSAFKFRESRRLLLGGDYQVSAEITRASGKLTYMGNPRSPHSTQTTNTGSSDLLRLFFQFLLYN